MQASCHLLVTGWTCVCDDGYVGDGRLCYGTIAQVSPEPLSRTFNTPPLRLCLPRPSTPQELMVLSTVSDFYTWTTVSLVGSAGLEVQVQVQKSTSISLFQDSGQTSYLTQQNLTLLVPSSDAVAKMSYDDKSFWTTAGNLATLVRSGLDLRTFA